MSARRVYTPDMIAEWAAEYRKPHATLTGVANREGVTPAALKRHLLAAGVTLKPRSTRGRKSAVTVEAAWLSGRYSTSRQVATACGCAIETAGEARRRLKNRGELA